MKQRIVGALALLLLPAAAWAHAGERMVILTLPTGWSIAGAALAVALTALVAVRLGPAAPAAPRVIATRRRLLPEGWAGWLSLLLLAVLLSTGAWGARDPLANPLVLVFWTGLRVALVLACLLFGDLWRPFSPWRAPVAWIRRRLGLRGGIGLSRLGHWPAVAGALGLAWFEIVALAPTDPAVLATVLGAYWLIVFVLAVLEGDAWLDRGECLTVQFALLGRIAPLWTEADGGRVRHMIGWPGAQVLRMAPLPPSGAAFVAVCVAAVSFDGLSATFRWLALIGVNPLEFPGRSVVVGANTLGLLLACVVTGALMLGAIALGRAIAGRRGAFWRDAGPWFLSFLPIAAGYHAAHYLVALLTDGQYALAALNDPFGRGWALLGLPDHWVSFGFLQDHGAVAAIWAAQVALILGAHVLAVLLGLWLAASETPRAHLPMTVLMVGFTAFGLWLLSAATGA